MNVVIIGYRRPDALIRLADRVLRVREPESKLILCIDGPQTIECGTRVQSIYEDIQNVEIRLKEENLGLRSHVIDCCDYAATLGDFVVLEEDCDISPLALDYARKALDFYYDEPMIGGISLYSYQVIEFINKRFAPLRDGTDTYFMQVPSSSGQCWRADWWNKFRHWMLTVDVHEKVQNADIPAQVKAWNNESWKKIFWTYLAETQLYFVHPYDSFSTNVSDGGGSNIESSTTLHQSPLRWGDLSGVSFARFRESRVKYDAFFESLDLTKPEYYSLSRGVRVCVNLHGLKDEKHVKADYYLSMSTSNAASSFGLSYKPIEVNIIYNQKGNEIGLNREPTNSARCRDYEYELNVRLVNYGVFKYQIKTFIDRLKRVFR